MGDFACVMTQAVLAKVVFGTPGGCAGCFELGVEDVLLIIAEIKLHRIGAVSLCHFCHFLSYFWVQKNCCKMFDFYNSSFQVLFSFGCNYPQQIVAKVAGKVKVFHRKIKEKIKEG